MRLQRHPDNASPWHACRAEQSAGGVAEIGNADLEAPFQFSTLMCWAVRFAHSAVRPIRIVNGSRIRSGESHRSSRFPRSHMRSGPAKDFLKVLQSRLHEVEICLLRVLSAISDDELTTALEKPVANFATSEDVGEHLWSQSPMKTTSAVRSWQRVHTTNSTDRGGEPNEPLNPVDDGVTPSNYDSNTACATEDIDSTWQTESAPFERGHTTSHASTTPRQFSPSELRKDDVVEDHETRLSHSSLPPRALSTLPGYSATQKHDIQQQPVSSPVRQCSSVISQGPDLACLPLAQQASLPVEPDGPGFPGHLFW